MVIKKSLAMYGRNCIHISQNLAEALAWFKDFKEKQMATGKLFVDPDFPPGEKSISLPKFQKRRIVWKRPSEIVQDPQCTVDGISRFDVRQGELGDCFFLAAVSCLCLRMSLFIQVVPSDQSFSENYCGMFLFRFWRYGMWVDVIVDDLLPTEGNKLIFMHSIDENEFWSPLLEKAYAKLNGSYGNLTGGNTSDVMVEFSGGITELVDLLGAQPPNLFNIMLKAFVRNSLMAACIEVDCDDIETMGPYGLVKGHAYSVTCVKKLLMKDGTEALLVRLRNPWGTGEFTGKWSDNSDEWNNVAALEKTDIELLFRDDGEFWMSEEDFKSYFTKLEMCHLGPQSIDGNTDDLAGKKLWETTVKEGSWTLNCTAGGCRNFISTFHMNPQYRVTVTLNKKGKAEGTVIISLMQIPEVSALNPDKPTVLFTIGYSIYKLPSDGSLNESPLTTQFFKENKAIVKSRFTDVREVCTRHNLKPGNYVVIPTTFEPNQEARFMLRIFSEKPYPSSVMDDETSLCNVIDEEEIEMPADAPAVKVGFDKLAKDGYLFAHELRVILNSAFLSEFRFDGFSIETCRSLIACNWKEAPGKLNFFEFLKLRRLVCLWKTVFKHYDSDKSGTFSASELREGMKHVGIRVSNKIFRRIGPRYSSSNGEITFDDFCLLLARLRSIFLTINGQEQLSNGKRIAIDKEVFIQQTIFM